jgi:hypothetical protein
MTISNQLVTLQVLAATLHNTIALNTATNNKVHKNFYTTITLTLFFLANANCNASDFMVTLGSWLFCSAEKVVHHKATITKMTELSAHYFIC